MKIFTFLLIIIFVTLSAPRPVFDVIPTSSMVEEAQRENINLIRSQTRSLLREQFRQQFRKKIHST